MRQWHAYEEVYGPLGIERLDYVAAIIAERITNTRLRPSVTPASYMAFLPKWGNHGDDS